MKLPMEFPNEADKVFEEAEAFRRMSASDRFLSMVDLIASGERLMLEAPRRDEARRIRQAQEDEWQRIHRDLFASHGH